MPDITPGNREFENQKIPRIEANEAARIFAECSKKIAESSGIRPDLGKPGFAEFLGHLQDGVLELAVQPDEWGERTKALLISGLFGNLRGSTAEGAGVEEITRVSNIVMPCFLLELGRRKRHIHVEFPSNPSASGAVVSFSTGMAGPIHAINGERLAQLVSEAGADLVGLCYFGDSKSREAVERRLTTKNVTPDPKNRPCRRKPS